MASPKFAIPAEYQSQLRYKPTSDTRSNDDILKTLTQHVPVTSEKNIWAYWHSGVENMPAWCQHNVISWVRMHDSSWTVRVLDNVKESPNFALKFVPAEQLPDCFVKGTMHGPYTGPHSADFLRGALLAEHGGVFLDAGSILFRTLDRICWNQLADPNSPFQVCAPLMYDQFISNSVVAARKGDPFIKRWHELFIYMWKGRTDSVGVMQTPLMGFMAEIANFSSSHANDFHWDFKVGPEVVFDYITQVACWTRMTMLEDTGDGFSPAEYWKHNILVYDSLKENWAMQEHLKWDKVPERALNLLATPLSVDPASEQYKEAEGLVYRLLTESCLEKITHGKNLTLTPALGVLWDMPENAGKDAAPGTFAELLRYGAENFEQTRETIRYWDAPPPPKTMKKGLFEP